MENHVRTSPAHTPPPLPGLAHDNGEPLTPRTELVMRLRVLLRCHDLAHKAARSRSMRIFAVLTAALSILVAVVAGGLVFVFVDEELRMPDEVAAVVAALVGVFLGGGGLILAAFLWVYFGQGRNVEAPLDEQIRSITTDHPGRVRAWGGPAVLRMPELVEEILRAEEERLAETRPEPGG